MRLLLCVLAFCALTALASPKLSPRVQHLLSQQHSRSDASREVKLWVFFHDKGPAASEQLATLGNQLHPHAARRRRNVETELDDTDLPVHYEYIKEVEATGVTMKRPSKWLNAISVSASVSSASEFEELLKKITDISSVSQVEVVASYTRELPPLEPHVAEDEPAATASKRATHAIDYGNSLAQLEMIEVPAMHANGYNGTDVKVLVLDSGYMKTHPSLVSVNIIDEYDFLDNDKETQSIPPNAQNSHGTATLSNLGGWAPGNVVGAGFGASFILAKTESVFYEAETEEDNFIAALEWGESIGAQVASASLGYTQWYKFYELDGTVAPVTRACDAAVRKGVVVVVSAGNSGANGIAAPADGFEVIAVGSVMQTQDVSGFSSLGPSADGRIKPDVAARGSRNWVANAFDVPRAASNNTYTQLSGTSFSCPLVAGVVAILLQAHPDWSPAMVKEALRMTASARSAPSTTTGWGIVSAIDAHYYKPTRGDCTVNGCSDWGCCNSTTGRCQCALGRFGPACNFVKQPCLAYCHLRSGAGQCQVLLNSTLSFRCGSSALSIIDDSPSPVCEACKTDVCGQCFGYNTWCDVGCDGIKDSGIRYDACNICGGDNSTCLVPTTSTTHQQSTSTTGHASSGSSHRPNVLFGIFSALGVCLTLVTVLTVTFLIRRRQKTGFDRFKNVELTDSDLNSSEG